MRRRAQDVMTPAVCAVNEATPYKEIVRLLDERGMTALPVVDDAGALVGIVSEADLLLKPGAPPADSGTFGGRRRRVERSKARALVAKDLMTSPVITVAPDASVGSVARLLHDRNVKQVPVLMPQGKVAGMVSRRDLLRVFLRSDEDIRREILDEIVTRTLWMDRTHLRVAVSQGVVTLGGEVDDRSLARWLIELIGKTDGVVGVLDRLRYRVDGRGRAPAAVAGRR